MHGPLVQSSTNTSCDGHQTLTACIKAYPHAWFATHGAPVEALAVVLLYSSYQP
jgi:hypothetical protein